MMGLPDDRMTRWLFGYYTEAEKKVVLKVVLNVETLNSIVTAIYEFIFKILVCGKFTGFFKTLQSFAIRISRSQQIDKNKVETQL